MEQYADVQQLMKKEDGQNRKPIYPPTVIQAVFEGKTGASLQAILAQFNSIYVQYQGTPKDTRLIIPMEMRRAGLTITYMDMESNTITERANSAVQKDNDHWGLDVNWSRVDELSLSGDISVSAKGTWIINGVDTGIKAVGPKGDTGLTPWLKTIDNKLHFSYDNVTWEPCSENIAAWFRWSGNKIQISRDNKTWTDLSSKFADNVHIKGYVANYASLPSGAVQGDIYGVGPTYAAEDTARTNPIYRYYVRNANSWVDNGSFTSISAGVVQETGDSETEVMSQKAVSEKLSELGSKLNIPEFGGKVSLSHFIGWELGTAYLSNGNIAYSDTTNVVRLKQGVYLSLPPCDLILADNIKARIIQMTDSGYTMIYDYPNKKTLSLDEGKYILAIATVDFSDITDVNAFVGSCAFESKMLNDIKSNIIDIESNIIDIESDISDIESDVTDSKIIDVAKLKSRPCSLTTNTWYGAGLHKSIRIDAKASSVIINADIANYVGFVTGEYINNPVHGSDIPYVSGTSRILIEANTETTLNIPNGAAYLILTEKDGAGNYPNYIMCKFLYSDNLFSDVQAVKQNIRKLNLPEFGGKVSLSHFIGWELGTVYLSGTDLMYGNSTSVIRLEQGISLVLPSCNLILGDNLKARVIKVTSEGYSTLYNYPDSKTLSLDEGEYIFAIAASDGTDITDVDAVTNSCRFESAVLNDVINAKNFNPLAQTKGVFSVMSYNVGGWYNGSGVAIPSEEEDTYLPIQQQIIKRYLPDFVLLQEYLKDVVKGGLITSELLFGYNIESVEERGYLGKAIASVSQMFDFEDVTYTNQGDGIPRHYYKGYAYCNGRKVCFVTTHLTLVESYAVLQIEELINAVKDEEYVIICMDSNIDVLTDSGKSAFAKFTDAGLVYLNKDIVTYPRTGIAIDNIVVSNNINCKSIYADTSKSILGDDADHYPLLAYLEIY